MLERSNTVHRGSDTLPSRHIEVCVEVMSRNAEAKLREERFRVVVAFVLRIVPMNILPPRCSAVLGDTELQSIKYHVVEC